MSYPPPRAGEVASRSVASASRKGDLLRKGQEPARAKAKSFRRKMTKAEVVLWVYLRSLREIGYNFRRQHPIGPCIADFAILSGKLVVEVDGAVHGSDEEVEHDRRRDAYLRANGWRILRVPNMDVYNDVNWVVELILSQV